MEVILTLIFILFILGGPAMIAIIIILHILTYNDAEDNIYNELNGIENEEDI